jgi:hypothetical protein
VNAEALLQGLASAGGWCVFGHTAVGGVVQNALALWRALSG